MATAKKAVKQGDRYEEIGDSRSSGRVVEVVRVIGLTSSALQHIASMKMNDATPERDEHIERVRSKRTYYYVKTETHPKNPDAVGRVSRVSEHSLLESGRYRKVSR